MPMRLSIGKKIAIGCVFAALAYIPDFELPYWGHGRPDYAISHSIFINGLLILVLCAAALAVPALRRRVGRAYLLAGGAAAWLSHLLLDSFYNHGKGVLIGWPVCSYRLNLPMPWFTPLAAGLHDPNLAHELLAEAILFGVIVLLIFAARTALRKCSPEPTLG